MLTSLVFVAAIAIPQAPDALTYTTRAKRLDHVIAELADLTDKDLEVGPEGEDHYLVIDVTDVPREELLRNIADVTNSRRVFGDDGELILAPDAAKREMHAHEYKRWQVEQIEHALERNPAPIQLP